MKVAYPLILLAFVVSCFYSCKKDDSFQQSALIGSWNMQKQSFAQYENNKKISDTVVTSSTNNANSIQFFSTGNYTVSGYYLSGGGGNSTSEQDTLKGVFSLSGRILNLSDGTPGLYFSSSSYNSWPFYFHISSPFDATVEIVSHTIKITQLTSSILILHTDYTYSESYPNTTFGAKTTQIINDYYYNKR